MKSGFCGWPGAATSKPGGNQPRNGEFNSLLLIYKEESASIALVAPAVARKIIET